MTAVLAIDTAGPVAGVALWVDGQVRERTERIERGTETRLALWIAELCGEAAIRPDALTGVASTLGPGAFTGLRVGLATAIGLAFAVKAPFWGVDSLETRARRAGPGRILSMLDARKGRVYAASYEGDLLRGPADVPPEEAIAWMSPGFIATGEGALVFEALVEKAGGIVHPEADNPAVDTLVAQAAAAFARGEGRDPLTVTPLYLREADAKRPG